MPLDPAAKQLIDLIDQMGVPPFETMTPAQARELMGQLKMELDDPEVASVELRLVAGVPCQIVTPLGAGPFPVLVWYHGGGWVIGSAENSTPTAKRFAAGAECVVVNVDYRLAPEDPFPACPDDCVAVARWVLEHTSDIGGDRARVAVGGDSAGGNLAAVVANEVPGLTFQLLVYPAVDLTMSSPSIEENGEGYFLTKKAMDWFVGHYLSKDADPKDPRVSPMFASSDVLAAAPPAHVMTAEFDPLRDEGEAYAARLRELGVTATQKRYDGQIHGFFSMYGALPAADEGMADAVVVLRRIFGNG
jgi:acetyl esterase